MCSRCGNSATVPEPKIWKHEYQILEMFINLWCDICARCTYMYIQHIIRTQQWKFFFRSLLICLIWSSSNCLQADFEKRQPHVIMYIVHAHTQYLYSTLNMTIARKQMSKVIQFNMNTQHINICWYFLSMLCVHKIWEIQTIFASSFMLKWTTDVRTFLCF